MAYNSAVRILAFLGSLYLHMALSHMKAHPVLVLFFDPSVNASTYPTYLLLNSRNFCFIAGSSFLIPFIEKGALILDTMNASLISIFSNLVNGNDISLANSLNLPTTGNGKVFLLRVS